MSKAYYSEIDPAMAATLRELMRAGLIAPGDVDERSIEDVLPSELAGYTQCHFFAGFGVWSYALRNAGWPDDRPVWTGSCPCQPFSTAGKGSGFADERHLWPAFHWLIQQCRPDVVFGEQVESKDGRAWLDLVQDDLEASSYAVGAVGLCAAGFGAPHIRHRFFFVADAARRGSGTFRQDENQRRSDGSSCSNSKSSKLANTSEQRHGWRWAGEASQGAVESERSRDAGELGESFQSRLEGLAGNDDSCHEPGRIGANSIGSITASGAFGSVANADRAGRARERSAQSSEGKNNLVPIGRGATNGFWRDVEWVYCRDGKYRAIKPGTFPLAHGVAARVVKLRGIGNAIVAPVAEAFIKAYLESL